MAGALTVDPLHEFFNLILKCFIPFKNRYNYYPHLTDEEKLEWSKSHNS